MPVEIKYNSNLYRWEATNDWKKSTIKTKNLNDVTLAGERFYVILDY